MSSNGLSKGYLDMLISQLKSRAKHWVFVGVEILGRLGVSQDVFGK